MRIRIPRPARPPLAAIALAATLSAAAAQPMMPGGMGFGGPSGPTEVGVITLHEEAVSVTTELPGRIAASEVADVRPQVGGIVRAIGFQPGEEVEAGGVLFELDDTSLRAQLAVQQASLRKAEAAESSAGAKVERYQRLADNNSVSQVDLLDAQALLAQAKADVASARANLDVAELNLSYATVRAPIAGVISDSSVARGALVAAGQATALATIRKIDPVYVDLVDSSANLLRLREQLSGEPVSRDAAARFPELPVALILENGKRYGEIGTLTSPDVVVSESTGTFALRTRIANPDRLLLPGMFVRADVSLGIDRRGFRVPQRAVTFDEAGRPTALFVEDGKAVSRVLTTDGNSGNDWIVTAGVADGAQLIVDGLQKIQAGSEVAPIEVTLDADGVVVEPERPQGPPAGADAGPPAVTGGGGAPSAGGTLPADAAPPTGDSNSAPPSGAQRAQGEQ